MKNLSEAEVDAWFAVRGIQLAEIRFQISPFVERHWLERFPRHTSGLEDELAYYYTVLHQAIFNYVSPTGELSPGSLRIGLFDAYAIFFEPANAIIQLDRVARMRCLYRLALAMLATFSPSAEYELPSLDDEDYEDLAPLPERTARRTALVGPASPARDEEST